MILDLPMPPSVNRIWRRGRGKVVYLDPKYRAWRKEADALAMFRDWRRKRNKGPFMCSIVHNAAKRRGDADNRIKAVLDWLQRAEIIENDSLAEFVSAEWGNAPEGCRVTLTKVEKAA